MKLQDLQVLACTKKKKVNEMEQSKFSKVNCFGVAFLIEENGLPVYAIALPLG